MWWQGSPCVTRVDISHLAGLACDDVEEVEDDEDKQENRKGTPMGETLAGAAGDVKQPDAKRKNDDAAADASSAAA